MLTPVGDMATLGLVGPGDAVGEMGLLRSERMRTATIQALAPTETYSLNRQTFDRLRRDHPAVDALLVQILADRVAELTARLGGRALHPGSAPRGEPHRRARRAYRDGSGAATIRSTQEDLASLAGTSRLTVSRVLRGMRERDRIEVSRGKLVVKEPAG